jgi:hypothetical protein
MFNRYLKFVRNFLTPEFLGAFMFLTAAELTDPYYMYSVLGWMCLLAMLVAIVNEIKGE